MLLALAFGQPDVPVRSLVMGSGSLPAYLVRLLPTKPSSRTGGAQERGGSGACFEAAGVQAAISFRCFHQLLVESGLVGMFDQGRALTAFAPSDAAFAHAASTLGSAAYDGAFSSPAAARELVRHVVVAGSHTPGSLSFDGVRRTLTSLAGDRLSLVFGPSLSGGAEPRTLAVGPADGIDGQAYMSGVAVRFPDGSVLIPVSRIPLRSWAPPATR